MNLKKNIKGRRGSYIVEAALTLPVFVLCVTALALIINIIALCENICFVTAEEVRNMDISAYEVKCLEAEGLIAAEPLLIQKSVLSADKRLSDFKVKNLDYLYTDNNINDLIAVDTLALFTVDIPVGIHGEIEFEQKLLTRGFTGAVQNADPLTPEQFMNNHEGKLVWVFPNYGIRYHIPGCRYVKQSYEGEEYKIEMQKEDARRKGYTACQICGGENK